MTGLDTGYVQIYTGGGKGKTTAALGLALRAAGAGLRVFFAQFLKGRDCSEIKALQHFSDLITVRQYGAEGFIHEKPTSTDITAAQAGLHEAARVMAAGEYGLVILDEAAVAVDYELFQVEALLAAIRHRARYVEVVITGRRAPQALLDAADLVTEMREIKHYYHAGVSARTGIEK